MKKRENLCLIYLIDNLFIKNTISQVVRLVSVEVIEFILKSSDGG